ncbi:glycosyltransferase family 2 protein [Dysgonomonas sp. 511]|uniref:glycosyltransferase family 2 protein n=1 Tax=Dysgonomonas sp. 511 TaxID=2302930 RepID=UPI001C869472|nr:glycosyltransferase family 2 protein [Dysgonomonas sp. 511]NDV77460.1 glycosyltransferase family 2 protein [Dysgonomonas sp. 511]
MQGNDMVKLPKVSVLMPIYNAEKYLSIAIQSIISQTFTDWELILINDGSTDKSEDIALSYADKRIRYYKNDGNKGLIYTRNRMIGLAEGEYIAFLDSDDLSLPLRLSKQVAFLDNNPGYALCGTWCKMIDGENREIKKINMSVSDEEVKCTLLFANTFVQSSIMIRRQVLAANPYDKDYPLAEDYELWCRLSHSYNLKNIPEHLTLYRWHGNNISKERKAHLDLLANNILKRELSHIGLVPNEEELQIHAAIRDKDISSLPNTQYLKALRLWMKKLSVQGIKSGNYDKDILNATIAFRWIFACKERKTFSKILSLPVHLNVRGYKTLFKLLKERL